MNVSNAKVMLPLLALAVTAANAEPVRTDFAYGLQVYTYQSAAAYELPVPRSIYEHAVFSDLRDLRVFNADGEVVPHAIRDAAKPVLTKADAIELPVFPLHGDAREALERMQITIDAGNEKVALRAPGREAAALPVVGYVVDARAAKQAISALDLYWPDDAPTFSMSINVEVSDDLRYWRSVIYDAPLVNLQFNDRRLVERRIEKLQTEAKFLRLTWQGTKALPLRSITAHIRGEAALPEMETILVSAAQSQKTPNEYWFDAGMQAPIRAINLDLPQQNTIVQVEMLSRASESDEWTSVATHAFYKLASDGSDIRNRAITVPVNRHRYWMARVASTGGGVGSGNMSLALSLGPQNLLFVARGNGPFLIAFGSNQIAAGETQIDGLLRTGSTANGGGVLQTASASVESLIELGGASRLNARPPTDWKRWLLWGVLLLGVAMLIWMARGILREAAANSGS